MARNIFYFIVGFCILLLLCSCSKPETRFSQIQTGDLLFQQWDGSDFAKAINAVTHGAENEDYAHIGLVLSMKDSLVVLEAVTGDGVVLKPLEKFVQASLSKAGKPRVAIGRLKEDFAEAIPQINTWALSKVGMPYDSLFVYGNEKYYCSELIHDAFNNNVDGGEVFSLAPMTFKDPETMEFFPVWENYFEEYSEIIPEGKPGINPGLMSRSPKIEIVKKLWE